MYMYIYICVYTHIYRYFSDENIDAHTLEPAQAYLACGVSVDLNKNCLEFWAFFHLLSKELGGGNYSATDLCAPDHVLVAGRT